MIKHIRIQNFRSIRDVSVDLESLTVLIGRSGTGKSNFVQAIRLLRNILSSKQQQQMGFPVGANNILPAGDTKGWLRFSIRLAIEGLPEELTYEVQFGGAANNFTAGNPSVFLVFPSEEKLISGKEIVYHQLNGKWVVPPAISPTLPPGQIVLGSMSGVRHATIARVALTTGVGCYDFPGSVLQAPFGSGFSPHQHQANEKGFGFTDDGSSYLSTAASILDDLRKLGDWTSLSSALRAVNRAITSVDLQQPDRTRLNVGLGHKGKLLLLDAAQESEGFRRFLAHLFALYQTPPKQTLIFEHPESGIHPGAMTALFEEFESYVRSGRGQIILTTHSPQLLEHFSPESIRVVDIIDLETRIGPLAPEQAESVHEHLMGPGELLTVDPARLEGQLDEVPG